VGFHGHTEELGGAGQTGGVISGTLGWDALSFGDLQPRVIVTHQVEPPGPGKLGTFHTVGQPGPVGGPAGSVTYSFTDLPLEELLLVHAQPGTQLEGEEFVVEGTGSKPQRPHPP
jgi:hypothetical protein